MAGRTLIWYLLTSALAMSASQELMAQPEATASRRYLHSRCDQTKRWLQSRRHDKGEEPQQARACLGHLKALLDARERTVERWLQRHLDQSNPLRPSALTVDSGHVPVVELRHAAEPRHRELLQLAEASRAVSADRQTLVRLSGNASVDVAVQLRQLRGRDLVAERLDGRPVDLDRRLISGVEQRSPIGLRAELLSIDQLSISSLCGRGANEWTRVGDELRSDLAALVGANGWVVVDQQIVVRSAEMAIARLNARHLNGLELRTCWRDLFRIGGEQAIMGELHYEGTLGAGKLRIQRLNGAPAADLLQRPGEQRSRRAFIDRLLLQRLRAERINGVAVSAAARRSARNLVRGQLRLGGLRASERLLLRRGALARPGQAYERLRIEGDARLAGLRLEGPGALALLGARPLRASRLRALAAGCWSRSAEQRPPGPVLLAAGASVRRLRCGALNGLTERDLLYADASGWEELRGLRLGRLRLRSWPRGALRLRRLSVGGARAGVLLSRGRTRVAGRLVAREARLLDPVLNSSACLRADGGLTLSRARATLATLVQSVTLGRVNGRDLQDLLARSEALGAGASLRLKGELRLRGGLRAERLNGQPLPEGLNAGHLLTGPKLRVGRLRVARLNGRRLADDLKAALSRAERQALPALLLKGRARFADLAANFIDARDLVQLAFADRPAVLRGSASFSALQVRGHVSCGTLNGSRGVQDQLRLPIGERAADLLVQAQLSWDEAPGPPTSGSPSRLLARAVNKHQQQLVRAPGGIGFGRALLVRSINGSPKLALRVSSIAEDARLDEPLAGSKTFARGLRLGGLALHGDLQVASLDGLDLGRLASRLLRKDRPEQSTTAHWTVLGGAHVARLLGGPGTRGPRLRQLMVLGQAGPGELRFHELVVAGGVSLRRLDGLVFDDLLRRRVHTDGQLPLDLEFSRSLRVLHGSWLSSLNGLVPSRLLPSRPASSVHGRKVFASRVALQRGLRAELVNDLQLERVHDSGVLSSADARLTGKVVFAYGVRMGANLSSGGEAHGLGLQRWSAIEDLRSRLALNGLGRAISALNSSCQPRGHFEAQHRQMYLVEDRRLDRRFARVQAARSSGSQLEIVTSEAPALCALPDDCSCRRQYIVDLSSAPHGLREGNANELTRTFHRQAGGGLEIVSRSRSFSERCSQRDDEAADEGSRLSSFRFDQQRRLVAAIGDYVSDAQSFQLDDELYVIVATFYSRVTKSHATDSLLYQFESTHGNASLLQAIPTNGAKNIHLFSIPRVGLHLLIACVKGTAESLLFRFNALIRQPIRAFATGGSKYLASVRSNDKSFVLLDNPDVRALQIFQYHENQDNFFDYQNVFFQSRISSLGVFYSADHRDAFVVTTTRDGWLYIYEYMFFGKFQLKMSYWAEDLQFSTPLRHANENYLFTASKFNSTVYKVVQQGYC